MVAGHFAGWFIRWKNETGLVWYVWSKQRAGSQGGMGSSETKSSWGPPSYPRIHARRTISMTKIADAWPQTGSAEGGRVWRKDMQVPAQRSTQYMCSTYLVAKKMVSVLFGHPKLRSACSAVCLRLVSTPLIHWSTGRNCDKRNCDKRKVRVLMCVLRHVQDACFPNSALRASCLNFWVASKTKEEQRKP